MLDSLLNNLNLEVEPFAFCDVRRRWRLRLSGPRAVTLHYVVSGHGVLRSAFPPREHRLAAGSMALVPPGVAHSLESEGALHERQADLASWAPPRSPLSVTAGGGEPGVVAACGTVRLTFGGSVGVFEGVHTVLVADLSDVPAVRHAFDTIVEEQRRVEEGSTRMIAALMNQCLIVFLRRLYRDQTGAVPWLQALADPRLSRALDAILTNPAHPHTVDSLARVAGMSRSVFAERFAAAIGRTAALFLRETRLRRAAELLRHSDEQVKAVALRVGFSSRSHFTTAFREHFGVDPTAYRAAAQPAGGR